MNGIDERVAEYVRSPEFHERRARASEAERFRAQRDELRAALQQIRDECGAVCPNFELCKHKPCESSAGAFLIAAEALDTMFGYPEEASND